LGWTIKKDQKRFVVLLLAFNNREPQPFKISLSATRTVARHCF
jgi:hypothetical protein